MLSGEGPTSVNVDLSLGWDMGRQIGFQCRLWRVAGEVNSGQDPESDSIRGHLVQLLHC